MAAGCRDSVKFVLYTDITTKDSRLAEELGHTNELTWWIPPTADGRDLEARTETDAIRLSVRVSLRIHISSSSLPLHHRRRRLDSSSVLSSSSRINIRQPVGRSVGRYTPVCLFHPTLPPSVVPVVIAFSIVLSRWQILLLGAWARIAVYRKNVDTRLNSLLPCDRREPICIRP